MAGSRAEERAGDDGQRSRTARSRGSTSARAASRRSGPCARRVQDRMRSFLNVCSSAPNMWRSRDRPLAIARQPRLAERVSAHRSKRARRSVEAGTRRRRMLDAREQWKTTTRQKNVPPPVHSSARPNRELEQKLKKQSRRPRRQGRCRQRRIDGRVRSAGRGPARPERRAGAVVGLSRVKLRKRHKNARAVAINQQSRTLCDER